MGGAPLSPEGLGSVHAQSSIRQHSTDPHLPSCQLTTATAATAAAAATMEAWWEGEALGGIPTADGRWVGP